ncbi:phage tail tape measure protein [Streptomyces fuscichromogenes]|uniref:Phage tail tape measure protein domain-containing protein n=1 Tax=Streptomyces fuscichromogenes TaxID=1324013 RepID=A0A917XPH7_9ACTN|nr:phage tail tape measure protein [Streptomyces fuscichromogenes]GGN46805.1 hypothetical protein GCM10011578_099950 [Streptomyces fuscichromogenes]
MSVLDELLVRLGIDADELSTGSEEAANDVESHLSGIAAGAAGIAVGALFTEGIQSAMDITEASNQLQRQLDLTGPEAQRAGQVAGDVYAAGFGESVEEIGEAIGAVSQNLGGFANLGSSELTQLTKDAEALSHTFEFDVAESTQAAGTLIKAGLAKDGTEAFDLLTAAAQKLPPAMREELPDVIKEYSGFFHQLGFDGPQMMGVLAEASKDPTFEIDKLADAYKEFTLQIGNTSAVEAPLKTLGLSVGHIQKLVNTGQGTKAIDEVTTALKNVTDQTQRTQLQAALFGGPGEDMGNSLLSINASAAAASSGMDDAAGSAKAVADSMQASPAQAWDSIMRSVSTTLGEALAPALSTVSEYMAKNPGLLQAVIPVVLAVAVALGIWAIAQWAVNSALLANPVTWIILGIVALVAIIVMIATRTTWFQDIWHAMTQGMVSAWNWLWNAIQSNTVLGWLIAYIRFNITLALAIFGWLSALPGRVAGWFEGVRDGAVNKTLALISWLRGLPGRILGAIGSMNDLLYNAGRSVIQGLLNGIMSMLGSLRSKLSNVTSMIPDWKGPMDVDLRLLTPSGKAIMTGLMDGIDDQVPVLERQLGAVTTSIPGNVNASVGTAAAASSASELTLRFEGSEDEFNQFLRRSVHVVGGGSVQRAYGYGEG